MLSQMIANTLRLIFHMANEEVWRLFCLLPGAYSLKHASDMEKSFPTQDETFDRAKQMGLSPEQAARQITATPTGQFSLYEHWTEDDQTSIFGPHSQPSIVGPRKETSVSPFLRKSATKGPKSASLGGGLGGGEVARGSGGPTEPPLATKIVVYHCGQRRYIINSETFSTCNQHVNFTLINSQYFHACISYKPAHMLGNDMHVRAMKKFQKTKTTCS